MRAAFSDAVNTHAYPRLFHRAPGLLRALHLAVSATTLRTWYVHRALRRLLGTLPRPFRYLDAGCGAGDFLLPYAQRYPASSFEGVDRIADNVAVCAAYGTRRGLRNLRLLQADLEHYTPAPPVDVIACVTVLQYIEDDRRVLLNFHRGLKPGGHLLLYVPVHDRRWFSCYEGLQRRLQGTTYDERQARRHYYTPEEVFEKLRGAGFGIVSAENAYGTPGKIAYEVYATLLALVARAPWIAAALLLPPLVLLLYPLLLAFMAADYLRPQPTGNGLLVLARKERVAAPAA